jgi:hypothetical protein
VSDPVHTILQQLKRQTPLHLACLHSMPKLLDYILQTALAFAGGGSSSNNAGNGGIPLQIWQVLDAEGNSPLHYACMSEKPNALVIVKMILMFGLPQPNPPGSAPASLNTALVTFKNYAGATPYDVAYLNTVRQYLLPIQLQAEIQYAIDNGGVGLPPGIDMGGLKVSNSALPPPPTNVAAGITAAASAIPRYAPPPMPNMTTPAPQPPANTWNATAQQSPTMQPPPQQQQQQQAQTVPQQYPPQQQQQPQGYPYAANNTPAPTAFTPSPTAPNQQPPAATPSQQPSITATPNNTPANTQPMTQSQIPL